MTFNEVMALIMPSIVALLFYSKIIKRNITWFEAISTFALFMFITNVICYGILTIILNTTSLLFTITFTMKYSILAIVIAVLVAILYRFIELNININLKVESANEKKD